MGNKGWIKRVLPFFATFAIGIFIAGLFGFSGPRFGHQRWERRMEFERLRIENEELKNENLRLKNENCEERGIDFDLTQDLPAPPAPPAMHHHPPGDRGSGHGAGSAHGESITR